MPSETAMATKPTVSEIVEPATIRESTSRPRLSVPSQCAAEGGWSFAARLVALGSIGIGRPRSWRTPAARATVKKNAMNPSETTARRLEKNREATRRSGLSGSRVFAGSGASAVAVIGRPAHFALA